MLGHVHATNGQAKAEKNAEQQTHGTFLGPPLPPPSSASTEPVGKECGANQRLRFAGLSELVYCESVPITR